VRTVLFLILASAAALVQTSVFAAFPIMPELPLALAAWAMIDGTEDGMLVRVWVTGLLYDLVDPGSVCFHAVAYLILAMALLPIRHLWFRRRVTGWAVWAAICSLLVTAIDGWLGGWGDTTWAVASAQALLTGAGAATLGWMVAVIPHPWHPLGQGGA
jgi:hypothetical protein